MSKRYSIVGTQFTGLPEGYLEAIAPGAEVTLVREADNKYDKNAVAIWIEDRRVGYVPKAQNVELARRIDEIGHHHVGGLAMDGSQRRAIPAKFVRSPNSGFPMVEVAE